MATPEPKKPAESSERRASDGASHKEQHGGAVQQKMNWLRAGVLGANDGVVSTAGMVMGVAAAGADHQEIITAGVAAVTAGAVSMALGEYVSVSAQRDSETELIAKEKWELENYPEEEHQELVEILKDHGMTEATANTAAQEMESSDLLRTHLRLELGLDGEDIVSPWAAAFSSAVSFIVGAAIPLLAVIVAPLSFATPAILIGLFVALALTGGVSATIGDSGQGRAMLRLMVGGALAMAVTFGIGWLFGTSVAG